MSISTCTNASFVKKFFYLILIATVCIYNISSAQNINAPADSIHLLLCKKWEVQFVMVGYIKVQRQSGVNEMNFEFNTDSSFILTGNDTKHINGTWSYNPIKKQINLTINGKDNVDITSLEKDELVMLSNTKATGDSADVAIVYRAKPK